MNDTWEKLFESLEVTWCKGCDTLLDHKDGYLEGSYLEGQTASGLPPIGPDTFHWRDRRMTRQSAYKAITRIAEGRNPHLRFLPPWRGLFLLQCEVRDMSAGAGRRFPRSFADLARARLRYLLSEYTLEDRRRMTPSEREDFRAAIRWAARS